MGTFDASKKLSRSFFQTTCLFFPEICGIITTFITLYIITSSLMLFLYFIWIFKYLLFFIINLLYFIFKLNIYYIIFSFLYNKTLMIHAYIIFFSTFITSYLKTSTSNNIINFVIINTINFFIFYFFI